LPGVLLTTSRFDFDRLPVRVTTRPYYSKLLYVTESLLRSWTWALILAREPAEFGVDRPPGTDTIVSVRRG